MSKFSWSIIRVHPSKIESTNVLMRIVPSLGLRVKTNIEKSSIKTVVHPVFLCFPLPSDCENGPEEPVDLRKRSGEDVADAVDGGDLGVLLQRLHQGAHFCHVVLGQLLSDI